MTPMNSTEKIGDSDALQAARELHRLIVHTLACQGAGSGAGWGVWIGASLLLFYRLIDSSYHPQEFLLWLLGCSLIGAMLMAGHWRRRYMPSLNDCLALLDAHNSAGGLIMCHDMAGAQDWSPQIKKQPQINRHKTLKPWFVVGALLFALPVALLPERHFTQVAPRTFGMQSLVEKATQQVSLIEEKQLLPEPLLTTLTNQLTRISENSDGHDPARILEALDHIQQELKEAAATEAEKKGNELTNMAIAEALTSQMLEHYEEWAKKAEQAQAIMSALQQFLAEAKLPSNLSSNLLQLTSSTIQLDPATLAQLSKMISKEMLDNLTQLQQLQDMKLIDGNQCRSGNCQGGSCTNYMCATGNLAQLLQDSDNATAMSLAAMCGLPGAGGISEGGGPSPMTWGEASSYDGVKFTDERFAAANMPDFEKAELTGLSASTPEVPAEAAATGSGALTTSQDATGSASQNIILPHHRQTVSRYFE